MAFDGHPCLYVLVPAMETDSWPPLPAMEAANTGLENIMEVENDDEHDVEGGSDHINVSIIPNVDVQIERTRADNEARVEFRIVGPLPLIAQLSALGLVTAEHRSGHMSPLAEVTIPATHRAGAGIPLEARFFACLYGAQRSWDRLVTRRHAL